MNATGEKRRNALMGKGWACRTVHVHGVTQSGDAVLGAVWMMWAASCLRPESSRQMQPLRRLWLSTNAWIILRACNWNAKAVLGWRFTKVELSKRAKSAMHQPKKRPQVGRATAFPA